VPGRPRSPERTELAPEIEARHRHRHQPTGGQLACHGEFAEHRRTVACHRGCLQRGRGGQCRERGRDRKTDRGERGLEGIARTGALFAQQQRCRSEIGRREGTPASRPGMVGRHHDREHVAAHDRRRQAREPTGGLDEAEHHVAVADRPGHRHRVAHGEFDRAAARSTVGVQPVGQCVLGHGEARHDPQRVALRRCPQRGDADREPVDRGEHVLRPLGDGLPLRGGGRTARAPAQQGHAHSPLQVAQPLGRRGLGQVVLARRGRDAAEADRVDEQLQTDEIVHPQRGDGRVRCHRQSL
jgi:hypothetical protein